MKLSGKSRATPSSSARLMLNFPERLTVVRVRIVFPADPTGSGGALGGGVGGLVELPSRVEEIEEPLTPQGRPRLLIAPPDVSFLPMPVDLSTEHILLWISTNSQMELPVRVQSTDLGLWPLLVQGPARRIQRRQFVRVPVRLPGQLTRTDLEPTDDADADAKVEVEPRQWPVTILDISEGGVCCLLAEPASPPVGSAVEISFPSADGELILVSGVVIRYLQPSGRQATAAVSLAIRFDDPNQHGDAVRRLVFAEQLRQRQVRLVT